MYRYVLIICLFFTPLFLSEIFAMEIPSRYDTFMKNYEKNAYCKISPNIKMLFTIPQDRDFDKKYIIDDKELLNIQCKRDIQMNVFLQNDV